MPKADKKTKQYRWGTYDQEKNRKKLKKEKRKEERRRDFEEWQKERHACFADTKKNVKVDAKKNDVKGEAKKNDVKVEVKSKDAKKGDEAAISNNCAMDKQVLLPNHRLCEINTGNLKSQGNGDVRKVVQGNDEQKGIKNDANKQDAKKSSVEVELVKDICDNFSQPSFFEPARTSSPSPFDEASEASRTKKSNKSSFSLQGDGKRASKNKKKRESYETAKRALFVGNLPKGVSVDRQRSLRRLLRQKFSQFGTVRDFRLHSGGYGFVYFAFKSEGEDAIAALDGEPLNLLDYTSHVSVRWADSDFAGANKSSKRCFHCGGNGHYRSNCPKMVETREIQKRRIFTSDKEPTISKSDKSEGENNEGKNEDDNNEGKNESASKEGENEDASDEGKSNEGKGDEGKNEKKSDDEDNGENKNEDDGGDIENCDTVSEASLDSMDSIDSLSTTASSIASTYSLFPGDEDSAPVFLSFSSPSYPVAEGATQAIANASATPKRVGAPPGFEKSHTLIDAKPSGLLKPIPKAQSSVAPDSYGVAVSNIEVQDFSMGASPLRDLFEMVQSNGPSSLSNMTTLKAELCEMELAELRQQNHNLLQENVQLQSTVLSLQRQLEVAQQRVFVERPNADRPNAERPNAEMAIVGKVPTNKKDAQKVKRSSKQKVKRAKSQGRVKKPIFVPESSRNVNIFGGVNAMPPNARSHSPPPISPFLSPPPSQPVAAPMAQYPMRHGHAHGLSHSPVDGPVPQFPHAPLAPRVSYAPLSNAHAYAPPPLYHSERPSQHLSERVYI